MLPMNIRKTIVSSIMPIISIVLCSCAAQPPGCDLECEGCDKVTLECRSEQQIGLPLD